MSTELTQDQSTAPVVRLLDISNAGLTKDKNNLRIHNQKNMEAIEGSVDEVGFLRSGAASADGTIVAGNGTFEIAKKKGAKILMVDVDDPNTYVIVRRTDLTDERLKARAGLRDNHSATLGQWDKKAINRLVKQAPHQMLLDGVFTAKEQSKLLREQEDEQEMAAGGIDDEGTDASTSSSPSTVPRPESAVRMVSIFLSATEGFLNHGEFVRRVRQLSTVLQMPDGSTPSTMTDTVVAVINRACEEWIAKEEPAAKTSIVDGVTIDVDGTSDGVTYLDIERENDEDIVT